MVCRCLQMFFIFLSRAWRSKRTKRKIKQRLCTGYISCNIARKLSLWQYFKEKWNWVTVVNCLQAAQSFDQRLTVFRHADWSNKPLSKKITFKVNLPKHLLADLSASCWFKNSKTTCTDKKIYLYLYYNSLKWHLFLIEYQRVPQQECPNLHS